MLRSSRNVDWKFGPKFRPKYGLLERWPRSFTGQEHLGQSQNDFRFILVDSLFPTGIPFLKWHHVCQIISDKRDGIRKPVSSLACNALNHRILRFDTSSAFIVDV